LFDAVDVVESLARIRSS